MVTKSNNLAIVVLTCLSLLQLFITLPVQAETAEVLASTNKIQQFNKAALIQTTLSRSEGGDGSGGGDVIKCGSGFMGHFFKTRVFLADTFTLTTQDLIPTLFEIVDEEVYLQTAMTTLKHHDPIVAEKIESRLKSLKFIAVESVPELNDDNINVSEMEKLSDMHCEKKQLAVQNLSTSEVRYNHSLFLQLSFVERALFKIHEAYIAERAKTGDTTLIRKSIAGIAEEGSFASFLTDTIYRLQMIPKFRLLRVYDNAVALFMMARLNQMTFDSWEQFHDKTDSTYKNIFDGSSTSVNFDSVIKLEKIQRAATYFRTYYPDLRRITFRMISKAYSESSDPLVFAEKLEELNGKTLMTCESYKSEVIQARIQTAIRFVIGLRPQSEKKIQAEYQQYLQQVSNYCSEAN